MNIMKTVIITENERGLLFKNGRFVRLLGAGKYRIFKNSDIEVLDIRQPISTHKCPLSTLLADKETASFISVVDVPDENIALHFVNGKFRSVIFSGTCAFWNVADEHEFRLIDVSSPIVQDDVPRYIFSKLSDISYTKAEVAEYQKALVFFDRKLAKVLDAGTHYFWKNKTRIDVIPVDMRLTQFDITGQEILTQDKVSLRINVVCNYRITDCVKSYTEIDDFREQLHVAAQLALREYVGKHKLDDILENKEALSEFIFEKLKEKEKELYIEVSFADVKDIILPGEIRSIMNTVLVAEKQAQANVITRREEVASTRSLLNTAKLMEENKTLYKLKELEYMERICENVGNITLNGTSDVLTQLASLLKGDS